ncbi:MAG: hypothetical protein K2X38_22895 [Gemmataceae bacterium]|nr:hypothetical protein [Gemmataceae bacterium]
MQSGRQTRNKASRRWSGLGQLSLVEHALCPLDGGASLVENLVHQSAYFFVDKNHRMQQATARIVSPSGLSATDEFYLWGLLALTFAQPQADANLFATPHYCLRQLGVIDQHARRGGKQYQDFAKAIERLSQVTYLNDRFYDPVRAEHRKVSFGFLSYSLPLDPESHRAWRIAWDPIFFDIVRAAGGSFRFDLATYKELDPATRRLFLLLSKIFARRATSPKFDLTHLAVNVLGFAPTVAIWDLKAKVRRCVQRLAELKVVSVADEDRLFVKQQRGQYSITLQRGDYFARKQINRVVANVGETPMHEPLRSLGFDEGGIRWLIRTFATPLLREWIDIALAAKERFGPSFFRKSPQAWLVDNLKNAKAGARTPPDWWHALRRTEIRPNEKKSHQNAIPQNEVRDLSEKARGVFDNIAEEIFSVFVAGGQPENAARINAERFLREYNRQSKAITKTMQGE